MSHTLHPLRRARLQRSELAVPGSNPGFIDKAAISDADAVETDPVKVSHELGSIDVYFNRGILSTQALTRSLPKSSSGKC